MTPERKGAWEESEHPRDEGGQFSESGGAAPKPDTRARTEVQGTSSFAIRTQNITLEANLSKWNARTIFVSWLGPDPANLDPDSPSMVGARVPPHPGELRSVVRELVAHADKIGATHISADVQNPALSAKLAELGGVRGTGLKQDVVTLPVDALRRVTKDEDDSWDDFFKNSSFGSGDLAAPGGGMVAPEQGMFRKPYGSRSVNKEFGDNVSVGVPLALIPTRPSGSRREDEERGDPGGPLFPHFVGGPGTGVHKAWSEEDHPRDPGGEGGGPAAYSGTRMWCRRV
jgi:hypothetical protein